MRNIMHTQGPGDALVDLIDNAKDAMNTLSSHGFDIQPEVELINVLVYAHLRYQRDILARQDVKREDT